MWLVAVVGVAEQELILVRHGDTAWSGAGRFTGHLDVPLSAPGRRQAAQVAECLAGRTPHVVVSSDLNRASETARLIAASHGLTVRLDPRLREEHLGGWQGLTREEAASRYPAGFMRWLAGDDRAFDGREGLDAVADRAAAAVLDAIATLAAPAGPLIVVTHCNTATGLLGRLLGAPRKNWQKIGSLRPAHWSALSLNDGTWHLTAHNEPGCPVSPRRLPPPGPAA